MKRQLELQHRLRTLKALSDAVGAMRSLSAHHFRQARQTLVNARDYRSEMDAIVQEIGVHQALHPGAPSGLLVIASDLGICGDYNARLARKAIEETHDRGPQRLYSVGRRARAALRRNSLIPDRMYDAPASLEGLSKLLLGLAQDILDDYGDGKIGGLQVVSAVFDGIGRFVPTAARLLPINPVAAGKPLRRSPYTSADELSAVAVREYLYITLYETLVEALAAEHGMRLMAAEAALEWLDGSAAQASRRLANAKSEASTQELLDIVAGGRQRLRKQRESEP